MKDIPKKLPVNCTDEAMMIREGIRLPKYEAINHNRDMVAIRREKKSYSKMKNKFYLIWKNGQEDIVRQFLKCESPKWGSFKFIGIQI